MKGYWEQRVGMLLDPAKHPEFVYSFKPTDGGMYGGQPRIDWHACDITGRYWLVEVKQHPDEKHLFSLRTAVSPGQRDALDGVATSTIGIALLAVGCGDYLFVFDWRDIGWRWRSDVQPSQQKLGMVEAKIAYLWKGPKSWMAYKIEAEFLRPGLLVPGPAAGGPATPPTSTPPASSSPKRALSALTSKHGASIRTVPPTPLSEPSLSELGGKTSSSENSPTGGRKSTRMRIREKLGTI
jgi:hypothetical protein